jgi:GTP-binding protein Era
MGKSGFVAIVGRPSSGKSTLVNRLCGHKISITSTVPQTTRNAIRGVLTEERGQIVFLDTPGFHRSARKFNLHMREIVDGSMEDVDAILYVVDGSRKPGAEEAELAELAASREEPVVCAVNKSDLLERPGGGGDAEQGGAGARAADADAENASDASAGADAAPARARQAHREFLAGISARFAPIPVSALTGAGVPDLLEQLFSVLPEGEPFYPADIYTDQEPRFRIAEVVREKAILESKEELPHALYVEVADAQFVEQEEPEPADENAHAREEDTEVELTDGVLPGPDMPIPGLEPPERPLWVRAFIYVERENQKAILVGRNGKRIKRIRVAAERELADIFPYPVQLDVRVKVHKKWRTKEGLLKRLIY